MAYRYLTRFVGFNRCVFLLIYCMLPVALLSQTPGIPPVAEQQLENITANNADVETEDDSYLQQLYTFKKNPININYADENELKELLSSMQIQQLLSYRRMLGHFINIYELQAIPGWDIELIRKIRYYVSISENETMETVFGKRLYGGDHSLLVRASRVLEKAKGYQVDTGATSFYPGSPQKLLVRYKYQFKNLLQYGIIGEKDAGEQFFKGKQKQGFDFYSIHFFARNINNIRSIALGDFTVNFGQGLIQWQSLAFKKSAAVTSIKREGPVLRPYNSAGEINFHRGAGIAIGKRNWEASVFISRKKIDANLVSDTFGNREDYISSLQTSGYHRTTGEINDKGIQTQLAFGGNLSCQFEKLHIGLNAIQYRFQLPLNKSNEPYNLYALSGRSLGNYSFDYSYTYKNLHFFGEAAVSNKLSKAFLNGILVSAAADVDISSLYRHISPGYQSLYTSAFTENTYPNNEKGLYTGITIHPGSIWRVDAYADFYQFPWLKFRLNKPSTGASYLLQTTYKPNKQLEAYSNFRSETGVINANPTQSSLAPVMAQTKQTWRTQFSFILSKQFEITCRTELLWLYAESLLPEQGFSIYCSLFYKAISKPLSLNMRWQYFETDSYNSRIYNYENDVLYNYSIPAFYGKGLRYYININYDVNKKCSLWVKWSQTIYKNKTLIGSGLEEIKGAKKSEIKVQIMYVF